MFKKMLAAVALSGFVFSAQALYVTAGVAANQNPSAFIDLLTLTPSVTALGHVVGGAVYAPGEDHPGFAARPKDAANAIDTHGNWLATGPSNNDNNGGGNATVFFGAGSSFVSFLWGSPDDYNSLTVFTTGGHSATFGASDLSGFPFDSNQEHAAYIGFRADPGLLITRMVFSSGLNAFEASNFSVTSPIPEPETYALMLAGLAAVAFIARRRKE